MRSAAARLVLVGALLVASGARALEVPDHPQAHVNDYANALTPAEWAKLEQQLKSYDVGTQQIAIAIWKSLDGESLEDFTVRVAQKWKIGGKKNQDGVLIAVFLDDHKVHIEVGYGLEGSLTDLLAARISREIIAPKFRAGDVAGGLSDAAAEINRITTGGQTSLPPERGRNLSDDTKTGIGSGFVLFFIFIIVIIVVSRRRGGGGGGGFTGGSSGWGGGGWSSGDSSSSSSDSGGFSGGGGDFGGGGASGSW